MNLSFAGCGFLGIYHVGVAVAFKKYAPHLLLHRISGASAGALAACCLLCDMPLGEMTSDFFRVVNEARSHSLGPFSPRFNIQTCLLEGLQKFLPPDAHERVNGKLHISLTRVYDGKNVIVSQFNSREDLLQALLCACFIPVFSGLLPPRFHGVRYMDGAFSDNLPTLDENTVTVSPFCGESDICPRDNSSQMFHVNWANTSIELSKENINRFGRILFPPKPEILSSFCQQGFDDALNFLHRNNLISCTRCLAVQSTFVVAEQPSASLEEKILEEYDPECSECQECTQHRKNALVGSMPDNVLTVFQTYIEQANKGLINWVFRHRGGKLLTALSLPAILPADIVCATLTNIVGGIIEQRQFRYQVLGNVVCPTERPTVGHRQHHHHHRHHQQQHHRTKCCNHFVCSSSSSPSRTIVPLPFPLDRLATLAVPDRMRFLAQLENRLAYRLMGAAPSIGKQIWAMSEFVLKNLNTILLRVRRRQKQQQQQPYSTQQVIAPHSTNVGHTAVTITPAAATVSHHQTLPRASKAPLPPIRSTTCSSSSASSSSGTASTSVVPLTSILVNSNSTTTNNNNNHQPHHYQQQSCEMANATLPPQPNSSVITVDLVSSATVAAVVATGSSPPTVLGQHQHQHHHHHHHAHHHASGSGSVTTGSGPAGGGPAAPGSTATLKKRVQIQEVTV
uniref:uncharacterized protein LOC120955150 isoform X4 n=1 Tax=Anopheles coluzzii TaxID=1518534 RepID=UPI0020FF7E24|nr:uncharacterized protein LOC120955150 isoform X4 [Anopheles coluzzii]